MNDQEPQLEFSFPPPPESVPSWAESEAKKWRDLDDFQLQVRLEEDTGLKVDFHHAPLSPRLWAFTYVRRELGRGRIYVNADLPYIWQQFAFYHELHHLLHDHKGCYFWSQTLVPLSRFETQADLFAWAAVLPLWEEAGTEW
ncbi:MULTISPECIES: ImmA/IrrE family metallo-endopeptidase [Jonquetella]|uniref:Putative Zn peptidase n=1 Tax=Jonquetella anthropi DSM 22815 TaxID=885272 RepID=H0UMK2_9BACT|nr:MULTISPECIES: ImmA/IrrE family metallo-endopeptidase [Jonquetella]EEX47801.1 hypothetical protein GCWU000246_01638 [Jonquetella anthropi E3_33 E1]EHM13705.1 putative Zn peptidase [Jonquetella anthropi DSM 22815]ERL23924.1 PF06114 domain protein [Jonquetella sp. BV3C21]